MNEHRSLATTVLVSPLRPGLHAGSDNTVDVLVRVQAPMPWQGLRRRGRRRLWRW